MSGMILMCKIHTHTHTHTQTHTDVYFCNPQIEDTVEYFSSLLFSSPRFITADFKGLLYLLVPLLLLVIVTHACLVETA